MRLIKCKWDLCRKRHNRFDIFGEKVDGVVRDGKEAAFMVIADLKKVFDKVSKEVIWWVLLKSVVERELMSIIEIYKNSSTAVRVEVKRSEFL